MAQMHWYTTIRNSINKVTIDEDLVRGIAVGGEAVCCRLRDIVIEHYRRRECPCIVGLDGYLGAEWGPMLARVVVLLQEIGLVAEAIDAQSLYKPREWIDTLIEKYTESDPSFGTACTDKLLGDIMDAGQMAELRERIAGFRKRSTERLAAVFVRGVGSAVPSLRESYDQVYFLDLTRVSVTMKKFAGALREPFLREPEDVHWKREMYFYYHVLDKHRRDVISVMDGYVDGNEEGKPKLLSREAYDALTWEMAKTPLKSRRFMQPGNWGGLHHKEYFDLPKLTNCAWDTTFYAPKQSCLVDIGIGSTLEIPFLNLQLQYSDHICGPYLTEHCPGLLPMIACIDDGYFPKPVHHERSNMPVHLHPDDDYARKEFNEHMGRYETYYIVEAYENANTMLGLTQHADVEKFKQKIADADKKGEKFDWTEYVKTWPSEAGDLYLIPAGTVHGTGGHQMILEMDTCPSNVGTEYSFFIYDFMRPSWDDEVKDFCAKPVNLQIKHGFAQARWDRREEWVKENLLAKPKVLREGDGWREDQYSSYGPMPFHIERLHFQDSITSDTDGRFCHLLFLTKGDRVLIRSKIHAEYCTELEWIQFAFVPAGFGEYECVNIGQSEESTVVKMRWKKG